MRMDFLAALALALMLCGCAGTSGRDVKDLGGMFQPQVQTMNMKDVDEWPGIALSPMTNFLGLFNWLFAAPVRIGLYGLTGDDDLVSRGPDIFMPWIESGPAAGGKGERAK